ncbi:hypothetical protein GGR56DRAFT_420105 [Xylariaceae sp. FL0804]|nr:hypothetical protein GGR56DRAFT_420105 [Xylariaceae sp. FL0804]
MPLRGGRRHGGRRCGAAGVRLPRRAGILLRGGGEGEGGEAAAAAATGGAPQPERGRLQILPARRAARGPLLAAAVGRRGGRGARPRPHVQACQGDLSRVVHKTEYLNKVASMPPWRPINRPCPGGLCLPAAVLRKEQRFDVLDPGPSYLLSLVNRNSPDAKQRGRHITRFEHSDGSSNSASDADRSLEHIPRSVLIPFASGLVRLSLLGPYCKEHLICLHAATNLAELRLDVADSAPGPTGDDVLSGTRPMLRRFDLRQTGDSSRAWSRALADLIIRHQRRLRTVQVSGLNRQTLQILAQEARRYRGPNGLHLERFVALPPSDNSRSYCTHLPEEELLRCVNSRGAPPGGADLILPLGAAFWVCTHTYEQVALKF